MPPASKYRIRTSPSMPQTRARARRSGSSIRNVASGDAIALATPLRGTPAGLTILGRGGGHDTGCRKAELRCRPAVEQRAVQSVRTPRRPDLRLRAAAFRRGVLERAARGAREGPADPAVSH